MKIEISESHVLRNGVVSISGRRVVSMDRLGMDGMSLRNTFLSNIRMNTIEKNNADESYMPLTILYGVYR